MPLPTNVLLRTQSDARLAALARDGHERAFEAIVERHRRALLRTCRRVLPEARAEDALQQALLAAWTAMARGDEIRELRPWLHRIAHNTALNHLRVSGYDFEELEESLRIADAADEELERRAVMRHTLAGLAALPARQRDALLAIAVEGRSQDEVASDLGLSSGAVRQLVHRARCSLRAAATAITPLPLVTWIAAAATRGEPMATRIGELTAGAGGAGAAGALAKAGAVAVVAGGVVTGPALVHRTDTHRAATRGGHSSVQAAKPAAAKASPAPQRDVLVTAPAAVVRPVRHVAQPQQHQPPPRSPGAPSRQEDSGEGRPVSRGGDDDRSDDGERSSGETPAVQERSGRSDDASRDDLSSSGTGSDSGGDLAVRDDESAGAGISGGGGDTAGLSGEGSGHSGGGDGGSGGEPVGDGEPSDP